MKAPKNRLFSISSSSNPHSTCMTLFLTDWTSQCQNRWSSCCKIAPFSSLHNNSGFDKICFLSANSMDHGLFVYALLKTSADFVLSCFLTTQDIPLNSLIARDVTAAMLMERAIAEKVFWKFDYIIMQNLSNILPLFWHQYCRLLAWVQINEYFSGLFLYLLQREQDKCRIDEHACFFFYQIVCLWCSVRYCSSIDRSKWLYEP